MCTVEPTLEDDVFAERVMKLGWRVGEGEEVGGGRVGGGVGEGGVD